MLLWRVRHVVEQCFIMPPPGTTHRPTSTVISHATQYFHVI